MITTVVANKDQIKSGTCPYCGAPYRIEYWGCRDKCMMMQAHQRIIAEAIDELERLEREHYRHTERKME